jgi:hypothetical protein
MVTVGARGRVYLMLAALLIAFPVPRLAIAGSPAQCGPGDRREPALQGEVPQLERLTGRAEPGYWCNLELVGRYASHSFANFDTYKNCAYYTDSYVFTADGHSIVLDVSDPAHPVKTATLTSRAMRNAGESLRVNQARGLLVADHYSIAGFDVPDEHRAIAVYDVSQDCAHPRLLADVLMPGAVGHEACFQPDGMIYYMSSNTITPIDLTDPAHPHQLSDPWQPGIPLPAILHGCSISDDGTRGYIQDSADGVTLIVDTSRIQARIPGAQPRIIGRFDTPREVQQSSVPLISGGKPYLLVWTEVRLPPKVCIPGVPNFGYPRILDVSDPAHPVVVGKIQTQVVLPENCARVLPDPTLQPGSLQKGDPIYPIASGGFLYDSHYCSVDRLHEPTLVACSQLGSGLRVYDIRDLRHPTEIAYYNTGTASTHVPTLDWAFARPVIRRDLGEVWWVTNLEGFKVAKFRTDPFAGTNPCPPGYDYYQDQYDLGYQACQAARSSSEQ